MPSTGDPAVSRREWWNNFFSQDDLPWQYDSDYEVAKYQQTLSLLPQGPVTRALELACAEGHFTVRLAPNVDRLIAADISSKALEHARERCGACSNIEFRALDFISDELPDDLDLIVCSEALYYASPEQLLTLPGKFAAALKPGGRLLMAHLNSISDCAGRTGFDFGLSFGSETIAAAFAACPDLALSKELRTSLYRIQLFQRAGAGAAPAPVEIIETQAAAITPELDRGVVWGGRPRSRDEVQHSERASEVPILLYHSISDEGPLELAPYRVSPAAFLQQMQFLREHGYHTMSLEEWVGCSAQNISIPGRPVIITFDDGYKDFATHAAPILESCDLRATVFLVTRLTGGVAEWDARIISGPPLKLMGWDEIRALQARGFEFGSHTTSHVDLPTLSDEDIIRDSIEARAALRKNLGREISAIAFPWGRHDARVHAALKEAGYKTAVRVGGGWSAFDDDPINLPRVEIFGEDDLSAFARRLESKGDPVALRRVGQTARRREAASKPDLKTFAPLFDAPWYLARNPDVAAAGLDPLAHYLEHGIAERRDPGPLFDARFYLAQTSRLAPSEAPDGGDARHASSARPAAAPLRQRIDAVLTSVWRRLRPSQEAGAKTIPARPELNPLAHYLLAGAAEGRDPHPLFDTDWYAAQNPDVAVLGMNPLVHFLTIGLQEGRAPHPSFEQDWSLAPDAAEPQIIASAHSHAATEPLVSVIVPVFNNARYLRKCLASILTQSLADIEVVCVDDGSSDGSLSILEDVAKSDSRVTVVRLATNSGSGRARNVGIRLATGRFIQFTDGDDILPEHALQTLYALIVKDGVRLARGNLQLIKESPDGSCVSLDDYSALDIGAYSKARFKDIPSLWTPWGHTTFLIERSFLTESDVWYPHLSDGEDLVFVALLLSKAEYVSVTDKIVYTYRAADYPHRTCLTHQIDNVRHAAIVRRLYLERCSHCWTYGYRAFLAKNQFWLGGKMKVEHDVMRLAVIKSGILT